MPKHTFGTQIIKETFKFRKTNTAQFDAGTVLAFEDRVNAEANNNTPHNIFAISNQDSSSTLFIFLDHVGDAEQPDYILFPQQSIAIELSDGISFTTLFIKNTHATNDISADQVKVRVSTLKRIST